MTRYLALPVLLLAGCAHHAKIAHVKTAQINSRLAGMQPAMQRQVLNAVDAGEGNPRIRALRAKLAAEPMNIPARLALAGLYQETGYPELQLEHLRLASARFPQSSEVEIHLARAMRDAGQIPEAAGHIEAFLMRQQHPGADLISSAAILLDDAGRLTEAEQLHRRAAAQSAGRDTLHNNLGYNLLLQKRPAEAATEFRRALELNSASATARNNLGLALAAQPKDALAQFQLAGDTAIAHNNLASFLFEQGDIDGARKEFEIALSYRRDLPQVLRNLQLVSASDGKPVVLPPQRLSVWHRVTSGLKHAFVSTEEKQERSTGQSPL